jgi:hypothetical protein
MPYQHMRFVASQEQPEEMQVLPLPRYGSSVSDKQDATSATSGRDRSEGVQSLSGENDVCLAEAHAGDSASIARSRAAPAGPACTATPPTLPSIRRNLGGSRFVCHRAHPRPVGCDVEDVKSIQLEEALDE